MAVLEENEVERVEEEEEDEITREELIAVEKVEERKSARRGWFGK